MAIQKVGVRMTESITLVERLNAAAGEGMWHIYYMNYFPREVDSLHSTRQSAEQRVSELKGDWNIEQVESENTDAALLSEAATTLTSLEAKLLAAYRESISITCEFRDRITSLEAENKRLSLLCEAVYDEQSLTTLMENMRELGALRSRLSEEQP